jgi:hypothetical protein
MADDSVEVPYRQDSSTPRIMDALGMISKVVRAVPGGRGATAVPQPAGGRAAIGGEGLPLVRDARLSPPLLLQCEAAVENSHDEGEKRDFDDEINWDERNGPYVRARRADDR